MENSSILKKHISSLYHIYENNGFISIDNIYDMLMSSNASLYEIDYVCDQLLSMGVIIRDDPSAYTENLDAGYDRAQTDYDQLYLEVEAIDIGITQFIEQIRKIQPPQHREWQTLLPQAKNGNAYAYQRLVDMYLRTVVKISLAVYKKINSPLADIIQEGCLGLMVAIDKYEFSNPTPFPAYYPLWVRQNILRETQFSVNPFIYLPVHVREKVNSIYNLVVFHCCEECVRNGYCYELLNEVVEYLGCTTSEAKLYIRLFEDYESVEQIKDEDPQAFCDNCTLESLIFEYCETLDLQGVLSKVLLTLTPKEREILQLRFGLGDKRTHTLEEIGAIFGVTRERIRQIEGKALRKLRHPIRSTKLKPFF